jgi:uncharacterized protein (DUF1810 family)
VSCGLRAETNYLDWMGRVDRFKEAQDQPHAGFQEALREIQTGGKRGHWIWYVFPQFAGLGMSGKSMRDGIADIDDAVEYLQDDTLRDRLLTITRAVAAQLRPPRSMPLVTLMGSSIDAQKLVSSMTLFAHVAETLYARQGLADYAEVANLAHEMLTLADTQGFPPCAYTLARLRS